MGQTSSQLASTQAPEPANTRKKVLDGRGSPSGSEIIVLPESSPKEDAAPKTSKKRPTPPDDDDGDAVTIESKKVKTDGQRESKKEQKARRSMPQHLRGTAIKPTDHWAMDEQPKKKKKRQKLKSKDLGIAPPAPIPHDEFGQPAEATPAPTDNEIDTAREADRPKSIQKPVQEAALPRTTSKPRHRGVDADDAENEDGEEDSAIVNPIGRPGPRRQRHKRKKDKPAKAPEADAQKEIVPKTQLEHSQASAQKSKMVKDVANAQSEAEKGLQKDGVVANPIGRIGPQRKPKKSKSTESSLQKEDTPKPQQQPSTMAAEKSTKKSNGMCASDTVDKVMRKDGAAVNPIGRPGPPKRKQEVSQSDARQERILQGMAQQAETPPQNPPETQVKEPQNSLNGVRVNAIGRPGPPRRKKQKIQRESAFAEQHQNAPKLKPRTQVANEAAEQAAESAPSSTHRSPSQLEAERDIRGSSAQAPPADRIPTPPDSPDSEQFDVQNENHVQGDDGSEHEADYDARIREGYVDPTDQIANWLNSQESPAPPNQLSPVKTKASRKRKRVTQEYEDDSDQYQDEGQLEDESEPEPGSKPKPKPTSPRKSEQLKNQKPNSATRSDQGTPEGQTKVNHRGLDKGVWPAKDKELADDIFREACKQRGCSEEDMKIHIMDWQNEDDKFKLDMYEAFPRRTLASIRKFCQRRYTVYDRGPWTAEQDEELRKQYTKSPNEWADIAVFVDRDPQACRDRWRNIIKYENTMERGPWSQDEEKKLIKAVKQCLEIVKLNCMDKEMRDDPERLEMMIDWKEVANKMEGKRSERRCYDKWQKLKKRQSSANAKDDTGLQTGVAASGQEKDKQAKKQKSVDEVYKQLGAADIWDVLTEIYEAVCEDPDKKFHDESTFWSIVATENQESKYTSALRRKVYYAMLEKYGHEDSVKRAKGKGHKAFRLRRCLWKDAERGKLAWGFKYRPGIRPSRPKERKDKKVKDLGRDFLAASQLAEKINAWPRPDVVAESGKKKYKSEVIHENDEEETEEPETQGGKDNDQMQNDGVDGDEVAEVAEPQEAEAAEDDATDVLDEDEEMEVVDELPISSVNSRYTDSLRSETPHLTPQEFLARCRAAGRRHRASSRRRQG